MRSEYAIFAPYNIRKDLIDQLLVAQLYKSLNKTLYEGALDVSGLAPGHLKLTVYNAAKQLYSEEVRNLGSEISSKFQFSEVRTY